MYSLNKQSRLITVAAEMKLADLKKTLAEEGLYLGYYPLDESHFSMGYYLNRRVANLYHYKYGSIADLTSSLLVELKNGKPFHLKDAPRAAIGPDFNRMIIGSREQLGIVKTATLRTVSLPEKVLYGVILLNSRDDARTTLRHLVGRFMPPLFFKHIAAENTAQLLKDLGTDPKESCDVFVFCLSGLQETVSAEEDEVSSLCHKNKWELMWVAGKPGREIVNANVHTMDSYREIKDQYRQFLWPASDANHQTLMEKQFFAQETTHAR